MKFGNVGLFEPENAYFEFTVIEIIPLWINEEVAKH